MVPRLVSVCLVCTYFTRLVSEKSGSASLRSLRWRGGFVREAVLRNRVAECLLTAGTGVSGWALCPKRGSLGLGRCKK